MLLVLLTACATDPTPTDTAVPLEPTLTNVQAEVFGPSCAFSGCHGDGKGSAHLSLKQGVAYANLVGIAADGDATQTRVIPGDAEGSYLVMKLEDASGITGDVMPSTPLDADRIQLVRDWIDAGAQDN